MVIIACDRYITYKKRVKTIQAICIGHLNIVDHLILGIALSHAQGKDDLPEVVPVSLKAWDPLCQGLASGELDAAFVNAPMAMDLSASGIGITTVMFSHRGGSQLAGPIGKPAPDFKGKSLLVPHQLSVQHMLMHKFMADQGLLTGQNPAAGQPSVCLEAVPLNLMPEMIKEDPDQDIAGFMAPSPVGKMAAGHARPILNSQKLWKNHPCCCLVVQSAMIDQRPQAVKNLVCGLFRAARELHHSMTKDEDTNVLTAAADFLGLAPGAVMKDLKDSGVIYDPELLVPDPELFSIIQAYMRTAMDLLLAPLDLDRFINPGFAQAALSEGGR